MPTENSKEMTDDPFYAPGHKIPPRQPKPGEFVWELRRGIVRLRCELRGHGEYGWECQLLEDGILIFGQRFDHKQQAELLADAFKREREADGWLVELKGGINGEA